MRLPGSCNITPAILHTICVFSIRCDLISKNIYLIQKKANSSEAGILIWLIVHGQYKRVTTIDLGIILASQVSY